MFLWLHLRVFVPHHPPVHYFCFLLCLERPGLLIMDFFFQRKLLTGEWKSDLLIPLVALEVTGPTLFIQGEGELTIPKKATRITKSCINPGDSFQNWRLLPHLPPIKNVDTSIWWKVDSPPKKKWSASFNKETWKNWATWNPHTYFVCVSSYCFLWGRIHYIICIPDVWYMYSICNTCRLWACLQVARPLRRGGSPQERRWGGGTETADLRNVDVGGDWNQWRTPRKTNGCPLKTNCWKMHFLLK